VCAYARVCIHMCACVRKSMYMREIDTVEDNRRETQRRLRRELVRVRLFVRESACVCVHMLVCVYICVHA